MNRMKLASVALVLLATAPAFAEERPNPHHVYRLDFTIVESEAGKTISTANYTLNLEEHHAGEIKMGSNVALAGPTHGATTRTDIGVLLRTTYTEAGDDVVIEGEIEITTAKDAQTFRKMVAKGEALVAQGKPATVASVDDPVSHKQYQVTVTATKLR